MTQTPELPVAEIRKLSAYQKAVYYASRQRQWVENCENNGISYTGPNGDAIRQADQKALEDCEAKVKQLERYK